MDGHSEQMNEIRAGLRPTVLRDWVSRFDAAD
jgi:hypothetical protein